MKRKICLITLFLVSCFCLTGCGKEECVKWETTTNGVMRDCSNLSSYEQVSCELENRKIKTTQECVEWK